MGVVVLKDAWGFSGCPWDVAELGELAGTTGM